MKPNNAFKPKLQRYAVNTSETFTVLPATALQFGLISLGPRKCRPIRSQCTTSLTKELASFIESIRSSESHVRVWS
jgi:hypothetical protein